MTAIYERELDSQLNGLTGYVYGAIMLLFAGIYVMAFNLEGSPDFTSVLYSMKWIALITIPLLTMRSVAEERHQKTDQLLYSLPLGMTKIVVGKYMALVTVMAMPLAVMALYPLALNAAATAGHVALKSAYGALVGYFFLGMALTAIGLFISSLMENVGLAAGACFLVMLVLHFLTPLARFISASGAGVPHCLHGDRAHRGPALLAGDEERAVRAGAVPGAGGGPGGMLRHLAGQVFRPFRPGSRAACRFRQIRQLHL